jgi:hypothetical protein
MINTNMGLRTDCSLSSIQIIYWRSVEEVNRMRIKKRKTSVVGLAAVA